MTQASTPRIGAFDYMPRLLRAVPSLEYFNVVLIHVVGTTQARRRYPNCEVLIAGPSPTFLLWVGGDQVYVAHPPHISPMFARIQDYFTETIMLESESPLAMHAMFASTPPSPHTLQYSTALNAYELHLVGLHLLPWIVLSHYDYHVGILEI